MDRLPKPSDEELLRRYWEKGDTEYIRELLYRYKAYIDRIIRSTLKYNGIFGLRAEDILKDVFQGIIIEALTDKTKNQSEEPKKWIGRISRRVAKRIARGKSKEDEHTNIDEIPLNIQKFEQDALSQLISDEWLDAVKEFMETCPEWHRKAFVMYYMEDYQANEIAEILGRSTGTVTMTLHRLKKAFGVFAKKRELY